jgi:hypothetical protein
MPDDTIDLEGWMIAEREAYEESVERATTEARVAIGRRIDARSAELREELAGRTASPFADRRAVRVTELKAVIAELERLVRVPELAVTHG